MSDKISRNDPCPCGSGQKYKKCCLEKTAASMLDFGWQKLRRLQGELMDQHLIPYATRQLSETVMQAAWHQYPFEDLPQKVDKALFLSNFFLPWFIFHWVPEQNFNIEGFSSGETIALQYSRRFGKRLSVQAKQFIETLCQAHYSFYIVLEVIPERSLSVSDILLNTEHSIKERQATHSLKRGDIVFGRILSLDDQSIFVGLAPYVIPGRYHTALIELRHALIAKNTEPALTAAFLRHEGAVSVMEQFFSITHEAFNGSMPQLSNTDGEPLQLCRSYFKLSTTPEEALKKLLVLSLSNEPEAFLSEAKRDRSGSVTQLEFPWLEPGNALNAAWDHTVIGYIRIDKTKLVLETNSEKRARKGQARLKELLGEQLCFQKMVIGSIEQALQKSSASAFKPSASMALEESPEVRAQLQAMVAKHWEQWFDEPIPLLDHQTPREAAKNQKGREQLNALLLGYERQDLKVDHLLKADILSIKLELGLSD